MNNESLNKKTDNNLIANNLKKIAFVGVFLGIIFFCVILICFENVGIIPGIIWLCGCIFSSLFIYAIGEIIDLIQQVVNNTNEIIKKLEN